MKIWRGLGVRRLLRSDVVSESNVELIRAIRICRPLSSLDRCIGIFWSALLPDFGSIGIDGGGRAAFCIGFRLVGGSWLPTGFLAGRLLIGRAQCNTWRIYGDAGIVCRVVIIIITEIVLELRRRRCCLRT